MSGSPSGHITRWSWWPGVLVALGLLGLVATVFAAVLRLGGDTESLLSGLDGILPVLAITTLQATLSTVFSLAAGVLLAWSLRHRQRFPGRRLLLSMLSTSMVLPTLVVALGLVDVFGRRGWWNSVFGADGLDLMSISIYGLGGIVLAHTWMDAPFMARGLLNRLENIPAEHFKLARGLGLSPWQRFKTVEWPAMTPAVPGLCLVIFLLSFTSFAIVLVLGGSPRFNTLEVAIYEAIKLEFDLVRAVTLAVVQLLICASLVLLAFLFRSSTALQAVQRPAEMWPEPIAALFLQRFSVVLFTLFFAAPLLAVVINGLEADFMKLTGSDAFWRAATSSFVLATTSALLAVGFALLIARSQRHFMSPLRAGHQASNRGVAGFLTFCGTIYLVVPALVLGLGFFLLAREVAENPSDVAPFALVAANVMMALPFALVVLTPAITKSADKYDRLAFSLNLRGWTRWRLIEWPVLRRDLGYLLALAFCLSLGDLGVIALFGSQDFATLPWLLYQKMGSYRTADAAGIALILLVLCLTVFFLVPRMFEGRRHAET